MPNFGHLKLLETNHSQRRPDILTINLQLSHLVGAWRDALQLFKETLGNFNVNLISYNVTLKVIGNLRVDLGGSKRLCFFCVWKAVFVCT